MKENNRKFTKSQKVELWVASGGKCCICNSELAGNWHADHKIPYSKGGLTLTSNGQSLCPACNLSKGSSMKFTQSARIELRNWQIEFDKTYKTKVTEGQTDFLLVACPGSGKTYAQLVEAKFLLEKGLANWIIVCVPTDNLRDQWAKDALQFGLQMYQGTGFYAASDYHGEVITYAQLALSSVRYAHQCQTKDVMLIADEVHHLSDTKSWGIGFKQAFPYAKYRLHSSGTPFRSDNDTIPNIRYQPQEAGSSVSESIADYEYRYVDAIKDKVCRPVIFPCYNADLKWLEGYESIEADFETALNPKQAAHRLRTALDTKGKADFVRSLLKNAHTKLIEVRKTHSNAAGLIVCFTDNEARRIAKILWEEVGQTPVLVTTKVDKASQLITQFAAGDEYSPMWIIAVKMVSEGVNIRRLRVGAYLSSIATPLFLRQVIGRVLRVIDPTQDETAYFYFPKDPRFTEVLSAIRQEIKHLITSKEDEEKDVFAETQPEDTDIYNQESLPPLFLPMSSTIKEYVHICNGLTFYADHLEQASIVRMSEETGVPLAQAAYIYFGGKQPPLTVATQSNHNQNLEVSSVSTYDKVKALRATAQSKVVHFANLLTKDKAEVSTTIKQIHRKFKPQEEMTEAELRQKIAWVEKYTKEAYQARKST